MLRPSLWFVTGQNAVCYDQVYDLLLVRTLYATTKFMICYWSEHCMVWPSLWIVIGQNAVCYVTNFMICYWSKHCMLRRSLWFVTGQNAVCYDQVYDLILVRTLYVTTKFMICYWSERCMSGTSFWFVTGQITMLPPSLWFATGQNTILRPSLWFVTGQNAVCYDQVNDYTPSLRRGRGVYCFTSFRPLKIFFVTFFSCWWQKSDIWSQASYCYTILWVAFLDPSDSYFLFADLVGFYTHWTYMHIFLSNYWWQRSVIWSQASYWYPISWETFLDPSDSYFLFADLVVFFTHWTYICTFFSTTIDGRNLVFGHKLRIGTPYHGKWQIYHKWALAHSSSCLLLVRTLYGMTKFMNCYWSERCMLRPSWWFVTGQNTMVWPSLWFGTGQNAMCNDQVWVLLLVRMPYVTTKPTICCWSEHCMLR